MMMILDWALGAEQCAFPGGGAHPSQRGLRTQALGFLQQEVPKPGEWMVIHVSKWERVSLVTGGQDSTTFFFLKMVAC